MDRDDLILEKWKEKTLCVTQAEIAKIDYNAALSLDLIFDKYLRLSYFSNLIIVL